MRTTVLVVDDTISTCHLMIRCLKVIGAKAECAESGAEAFVSMAKSRPKLVFLDYMMPEMDGLEVLSRMKADPILRSIPVVMFTANDTKHLRDEAMRLGAIGILVKGTANVRDLQRYVMEVRVTEQPEVPRAVMTAEQAE